MTLKKIPHIRLNDDNEVFESFARMSELGKGAFGQVFHVIECTTRENYAMKIIRKHKIGSREAISLSNEIEILKKVNHPNLLRIFRVIETRKNVYLITELCNGGELGSVLKKKTKLPERIVRKFVQLIANALAYLHKHSIVHRDLKLENILLTIPYCESNDSDINLKISDFGLSETRATLNQSGLLDGFCGTPNYMAPEIIDNKHYSQQCDIWAFGIIIFKLLVGKYPFEHDNSSQLMKSICTKDVNWKQLHISEECLDLLKRTLHKDPAHRICSSEILNHPFYQNKKFTECDIRLTKNIIELMREHNNEKKSENVVERNKKIIKCSSAKTRKFATNLPLNVIFRRDRMKSPYPRKDVEQRIKSTREKYEAKFNLNNSRDLKLSPDYLPLVNDRYNWRRTNTDPIRRLRSEQNDDKKNDLTSILKSDMKRQVQTSMSTNHPMMKDGDHRSQDVDQLNEKLKVELKVNVRSNNAQKLRMEAAKRQMQLFSSEVKVSNRFLPKTRKSSSSAKCKISIVPKRTTTLLATCDK
ncbi:hypothetical protein SNEBB_003151 [Seison nebaliae]|nr:hypothetical protein SNEBB_003151 [Seison nebaliae]